MEDVAHNVAGIFEDEVSEAAGITNDDQPITAATIKHAHELISTNPLQKMMYLKGGTSQQLAAKAHDSSE